MLCQLHGRFLFIISTFVTIPFDFKRNECAGDRRGIRRCLAIALSQNGCKVYALSRTKSTLDTLFYDYAEKKKCCVWNESAGHGSRERIGRAVAIALSQSGSKVYALSRTKSTLDTLMDEHPSIVPIVTDLYDWDDTRGKLEKLEVLDGLVNNAGILGFNFTALECPQEYICKLLDNNLLSAINCSQVIAKKMITAKVKGSIVNVSSIGGLRSFQNGLPYHMSKAGLDMVSKQFALELGPHGIRVNSVNPGLVRTALMQAPMEKGFPTEILAVEICPMGRILELPEAVDPILYLLSDHSSMVTGQTHVVDGGMLSNITIKV